MTPIKALKAGAGLMMRTPADDAAWVAKCYATTERLKVKEATAKAGASAQEGAGIGEPVRGPKQVEAAPSSTEHDGPGSGGLEPGSATRTLETVEAPQDAGEEEGRLEQQRQLQQHQQGEPQLGAERGELDQPGEPVIEAEQEVAMPSPNIPVEVPADRRPVLP
jgi:hypothetical protein